MNFLVETLIFNWSLVRSKLATEINLHCIDADIEYAGVDIFREIVASTRRLRGSDHHQHSNQLLLLGEKKSISIMPLWANCILIFSLWFTSIGRNRSNSVWWAYDAAVVVWHTVGDDRTPIHFDRCKFIRFAGARYAFQPHRQQKWFSKKRQMKIKWFCRYAIFYRLKFVVFHFVVTAANVQLSLNHVNRGKLHAASMRHTQGNHFENEPLLSRQNSLLPAKCLSLSQLIRIHEYISMRHFPFG